MHRGDPKRFVNARARVVIMETCSKLRRDWSRRRAGQSQFLHTSAHRKSVTRVEPEQLSKVVALNCVANSIIISTTSRGSGRWSVVITVVGDPVETPSSGAAMRSEHSQ